MLTRLKVHGFKNLINVDLYFGPFTCIAGANGVGKSNLFDAIRFLSALADQPLVDAALSVRDEGGKTGDVRSLFSRSGVDTMTTMTFEVEMIVPPKGVDDLGQEAAASITFLRYKLQLAARAEDQVRAMGALELISEELNQINIGDARNHLPFAPRPAWRNSAIQGRRTSPFISTEMEGSSRLIKVHQDGVSGRPRHLLATNLPRTVLSASTAAENPTALLARREMQSWRLLQLEPSAMRQPDDFHAPNQLAANGPHLAATLDYLAQGKHNGVGKHEAAQIYSQAANRLAELIDEVRTLRIDRDERRELLTLFVTGRDQTSHPARALSDGTLRFLALTVLALDPRQRGVICLEEPENGIHPERIPAMLQLLQDIATDPNQEVNDDNPLRQVIINTHSPTVVQLVPEDSLLIAEPYEHLVDQHRRRAVRFAALPQTWRAERNSTAVISLGHLLAYLNPVGNPAAPTATFSRARRVIDRDDMQMLLPFASFPNV
jgi:predicted ATPase